MRFTELLESGILKTAQQLQLGVRYPGEAHLRDLEQFSLAAALTGNRQLQKAVSHKLRALWERDPELYERFIAPFATDTALLKYYLATGDKKALKEIIRQNKYQAKKLRREKTPPVFGRELEYASRFMPVLTTALGSSSKPQLTGGMNP